MRKLIGSVVATFALLTAGMANAATVDLFLTQGSSSGVATNDWRLTINVNSDIQIGGIAFEISSGAAGAFVLGQGVASIDPCTGLSFCQDNAGPGPGLARYGLAAGTQTYISSGLVTGFLIGTFTTTTGPVVLLPANPGDGDTVTILPDYNPIDFSLTTTPFVAVPEPAMLVLLGVGLSVISLARRKSA